MPGAGVRSTNILDLAKTRVPKHFTAQQDRRMPQRWNTPTPRWAKFWTPSASTPSKCKRCGATSIDMRTNVQPCASPMLMVSGCRKNRVIHSSTAIPMANQMMPYLVESADR